MSKKQRRVQTPKPRNEEWARARLDHSNRNLTVPSGKRYNRKEKYKGKDWA